MLNFKNVLLFIPLFCLLLAEARAINVIEVGMIDDNPPYSDFDVLQGASGMLPSLLDLLSTPDLIEFKPVRAANQTELEKMLKERKVKVIFPPPFSIPPRDVLVSKPFGLQNWKLIARANYFPSRDMQSVNFNNKRIYVVRNSPVINKLTSIWPTISLEMGTNMNEALKLLNIGAVDGIVIDSTLADVLTKNIPPNQIIKVDLAYIFAANMLWLAPDQHDLLKILNERIDKLQPGTTSSIITYSFLHSMLLDKQKYNLSENTITNIWIIVFSISSLFLIMFLLSEIFRRRRAERHLLDSLTYWQTLLNSVPTPLLVCDLTGKITHCNQTILSTLSLNSEQVVGSTFEKLTQYNFIEPSLNHLEWVNAINTLESQFSDRRITIQSTNTVCDITLWMAVYKDSRSIPQGILLGWFDISERKRLENELVVTTQQAISASNEKSDFLVRMSHEIRSPMNAILGILELELQKQQQPDSALNVAYTASRQLLGIIGNILDLSKIEAGKMQLQQENCNLTALLIQLTKTYSILADQKGLRLESDIEAVFKQHYCLDSTRLTQILSNLLSNAIKYTDKGFVRLHVTRESAYNEHDLLTFKVEDTGIGIAPDMQKKILNPYIQIEPHSPASTGLGLTICTKLLALMNSKLRINSEPGEGSCFSFALTQEKAKTNENLNTFIKKAPKSESVLRVLVVDDQRANLVVMKLQLETLGHGVITCNDPKQAQELLAEQRFDIVLLDCQMPIMTGYELARQQRLSEQHTKNYQVIIGCTANAISNEQKKCLEAGMDNVLIKPINLQDLQKELLKQSEAMVNMEEIIALTANQPQLINAIIDELQRNSEEQYALLLNMAADNIKDVKEYESIIHRQKGSFALAGFMFGVDHCQSIEQALAVKKHSQLPVYCLQLNRLILRFIFLLQQQRILQDVPCPLEAPVE